MKTKLSIAITAALLSTTSHASTENKYLPSDALNKFNGTKVTLQTKEKKQAVAWMVKLNTHSIATQSKNTTFQVDSAQQTITDSQARVQSSIDALGDSVRVLAKTSKLVNSIVVEGDEHSLKSLLNNPDIADIYPVYDYDLDVVASAEYINATKIVEATIASGKGQRIAILDTGVDYTHAALGGSGKVEDYEKAVESADTAPNWPQGNVIGGYDFINFDGNPLDVDTNHGTHVSHSVLGVAPDAELLVYSVCNSGCPGLSQLLALEAAMDPNDDGNIEDRVDTVNMSLGGDFGDNKDDAVQVMIDEMVELGVNLVISAGNDGATPFIVGGPSTTDSALSVGAMTHPTTKQGAVTATLANIDVTAYSAGFNTSHDYDFNGNETTLIYPDANQTGCDSFADEIDFTGQAVIMDRGDCSFTQKVLSAQNKGAIFVIIANNKDNDGAFVMGGSDPAVIIPSIMISKEDGDIIKADLVAGNNNYSIASEGKSTSGAIASFTSRGPSTAGTLKPEITAPGTDILTAHPGQGDGLSPISGTSFSAPITAGAMSIIKEALPNRSALEIKATMMNTANLDVTMEAREINSDTELAPISYIGAGLVDVEKAINSSVAAWNKDTKQAALAYGLVTANEVTSITKTVSIKNFATENKTYSLNVNQRFKNDLESTALTFDLPESITVPAGQIIEFDVTATLDPSKLPQWQLTSWFEIDNSSEEATAALTLSEYDGAIEFKDGDETALHLVYHMLPKTKGAVSLEQKVLSDDSVAYILKNTGTTTLTNLYAVPLTASSPVNDNLRHDLINASSQMIQDGNCTTGYAIDSVLQTRQPIAHALNASYKVDFDVDNNGEWDYSLGTVYLKWFDDGYPAAIYGGVGNYGESANTLRFAYHTTGNDFITLYACLEDLGLDKSAVGNEITVNYRIEEDKWAQASTGNGDELKTSLLLEESTFDIQLQGMNNETITELSPGDIAVISGNDDYMLLSEEGALSFIPANPVEENDISHVAPSVTSTDFTISPDTAPGTILGQLTIIDEDETSPFSEVIILENNSAFLMIDKEGTVSLSEDAKLTTDMSQMIAEVVAFDTLGNRSEPASVTVTIQAEEQTEEKAKSTSSGGSLAWFSLLLLPFAALRRRK
ncbi:S8 family serine peptidase [uncultured Shewanella sp.]|uniref:S8 family serine peptidase n=1 Tax=uncultured Shewanella sp. TaxID=173975 RepID=UPI00260F93FA|nr:S8 family serine peptidase [uncultured Shewanella sp.]